MTLAEKIAQVIATKFKEKVGHRFAEEGKHPKTEAVFDAIWEQFSDLDDEDSPMSWLLKKEGESDGTADPVMRREVWNEHLNSMFEDREYSGVWVDGEEVSIDPEEGGVDMDDFPGHPPGLETMFTGDAAGDHPYAPPREADFSSKEMQATMGGVVEEMVERLRDSGDITDDMDADEVVEAVQNSDDFYDEMYSLTEEFIDERHTTEAYESQLQDYMDEFAGDWASTVEEMVRDEERGLVGGAAFGGGDLEPEGGEGTTLSEGEKEAVMSMLGEWEDEVSSSRDWHGEGEQGMDYTRFEEMQELLGGAPGPTELSPQEAANLLVAMEDLEAATGNTDEGLEHLLGTAAGDAFTPQVGQAHPGTGEVNRGDAAAEGAAEELSKADVPGGEDLERALGAGEVQKGEEGPVEVDGVLQYPHDEDLIEDEFGNQSYPDEGEGPSLYHHSGGQEANDWLEDRMSTFIKDNNLEGANEEELMDGILHHGEHLEAMEDFVAAGFVRGPDGSPLTVDEFDDLDERDFEAYQESIEADIFTAAELMADVGAPGGDELSADDVPGQEAARGVEGVGDYSQEVGGMIAEIIAKDAASWAGKSIDEAVEMAEKWAEKDGETLDVDAFKDSFTAEYTERTGPGAGHLRPFPKEDEAEDDFDAEFEARMDTPEGRAEEAAEEQKRQGHGKKPAQEQQKPTGKRKRCPKGSRKNPKTGQCEPYSGPKGGGGRRGGGRRGGGRGGGVSSSGFPNQYRDGLASYISNGIVQKFAELVKKKLTFDDSAQGAAAHKDDMEHGKVKQTGEEAWKYYMKNSIDPETGDPVGENPWEKDEWIRGYDRSLEDFPIDQFPGHPEGERGPGGEEWHLGPDDAGGLGTDAGPSTPGGPVGTAEGVEQVPKPSANVDRMGVSSMDFENYEKWANTLSDEELLANAKDAQEAIDAFPENPKAGYYQDEIHVAADILHQRKQEAATSSAEGARADLPEQGGGRKRCKKGTRKNRKTGKCEPHSGNMQATWGEHGPYLAANISKKFQAMIEGILG